MLTDTGSLFSTNPAVTRRVYQCTMPRTDRMKEVAIRLLIRSIAEAAGRHGKGIEVMGSTAAHHFLQVRPISTPSLWLLA